MGGLNMVDCEIVLFRHFHYRRVINDNQLNFSIIIKKWRTLKAFFAICCADYILSVATVYLISSVEMTVVLVELIN